MSFHVPVGYLYVFFSKISDKGWISKIYQELIQLKNNLHPKQPYLKMGRDIE